MNQIEEFKSLMNDFRKLITKVQDNNTSLKEKVKEKDNKSMSKRIPENLFSV